MGRFVGGMVAAALLIGASATAASAQVRVGINTRDFGVNVAIGSPRVYVVDRHYGPYYPPVPVRGAYIYQRGRDRYSRDREYRRDVREARREYERDIREAQRDYRRDIREARRDRLR